MKYFKIFGSECYFLRDRENLEKFNAKSDKGIFLGCSTSSKAYRIYNLRTKTVMRSTNMVINDEQSIEDMPEEFQVILKDHVEDSLPMEYVSKAKDQELQILKDVVSESTTPVCERIQEQGEASTPTRQNSTSTSLVKVPSSRFRLNHPKTNILGSLNENMQLRSKVLNVVTHSCYLSQIEPKKVDEA